MPVSKELIYAAQEAYGDTTIIVQEDAAVTETRSGYWIEARVWIGKPDMPTPVKRGRKPNSAKV
jgi:hypothetical protein